MRTETTTKDRSYDINWLAPLDWFVRGLIAFLALRYFGATVSLLQAIVGVIAWDLVSNSLMNYTTHRARSSTTRREFL